jgi:hypothetical protein
VAPSRILAKSNVDVVPGPIYRILPDKRMQRAAVKSSTLFNQRRAGE